MFKNLIYWQHKLQDPFEHSLVYFPDLFSSLHISEPDTVFFMCLFI